VSHSLDAVMASPPARNGARHTTHTDDLLKPIKWVHHDLEQATDMVLHSIDRGLKRNELTTVLASAMAIQTPANYLFDQMTKTNTHTIKSMACLFPGNSN
jgi:hypothetical protein